MEVTQSAAATGLGRLTWERGLNEQYEASRPDAPDRLSPRGRIDALVDEGSFVELGSLTRSQLPHAPVVPADGLVAGWARVAGREVGVLAEDGDAMAQTDGQVASNKRFRILNTCVIRRVPLLYLVDGPQEQPTGTVASGKLFGFMSRQMREPVYGELAAPSLALVFGRCSGAAGELVAACHAVLKMRGRGAFPGGRSFDSELEMLQAARRMLGTLPGDAGCSLPRAEPAAPPVAFSNAMAVHPPLDAAVDGLFDDGSVVDLVDLASLRAGTARVDGWPLVFAACGGDMPPVVGAHEVRAIGAAARLARMARVPLLLVQDCDGYDPDADEEQLLLAVHQTLDELRATSTPKFGLVMGHGHVLGTWVLGGRRLGMDFLAALPTAEITALDLPLYRPGSAERGDGPWLAAGLGHVDEVVAPTEVRDLLSNLLSITATARSVPAPEQDRSGRFVDDIAKV